MRRNQGGGALDLYYLGSSFSIMSSNLNEASLEYTRTVIVALKMPIR
jgi:hypothetical protein